MRSELTQRLEAVLGARRSAPSLKQWTAERLLEIIATKRSDDTYAAEEFMALPRNVSLSQGTLSLESIVHKIEQGMYSSSKEFLGDVEKLFSEAKDKARSGTSTNQNASLLLDTVHAVVVPESAPDTSSYGRQIPGTKAGVDRRDLTVQAKPTDVADGSTDQDNAHAPEPKSRVHKADSLAHKMAKLVHNDASIPHFDLQLENFDTPGLHSLQFVNTRVRQHIVPTDADKVSISFVTDAPSVSYSIRPGDNELELATDPDAPASEPISLVLKRTAPGTSTIEINVHDELYRVIIFPL